VFVNKFLLQDNIVVIVMKINIIHKGAVLFGAG